MAAVKALCASGCVNGPEDEHQRISRNHSLQISRDLQQNMFQILTKKMILFLGTGESGKSTLFKQLKYINKDNDMCPTPKLMKEKSNIQGMMITDIVNMVRGSGLPSVRAALGFDADAALPWSQAVIDQNKGEAITASNAKTILAKLCTPARGASSLGFEFTALAAIYIETLWTDALSVKLYEHRNQFLLGDHAKYFLDRAKMIANPFWVPEEEDIVRARLKTTGIVEQTIKKDSSVLTILDVGGQRSERRKWIQHFDRVTALVFVVAISEFDEVCSEDIDMPRSEESFKVFNGLIREPALSRCGLIVFFNKMDVLAEKLNTRSFGTYVKEFKGENTIKAVSAFMRSKYDKAIRDASAGNIPRTTDFYFTTAIDKSNVDRVFQSVLSIVLAGTIADSGLA